VENTSQKIFQKPDVDLKLFGSEQDNEKASFTCKLWNRVLFWKMNSFVTLFLWVNVRIGRTPSVRFLAENSCWNLATVFLVNTFQTLKCERCHLGLGLWLKLSLYQYIFKGTVSRDGFGFKACKNRLARIKLR
jgi:hypothetical protein